jgi:pimeloyl-ACP methyl ester carboxylesterase
MSVIFSAVVACRAADCRAAKNARCRGPRMPARSWRTYAVRSCSRSPVTGTGHWALTSSTATSRTSDSTVCPIDHEADLLAAVLDSFGVDRAGVLAWSGGGPSAYRLAVRHPERVAGLVAVAALSARWVEPAPTLAERFMFGTRAGQGLIEFLARRAPGQVVGGALEGEGSVRGDELKTLTAGVMANPEQRRAVLAFSTTVSRIGPRRAGWENDVANFGVIDSLELDRVRGPVLLIHGEVDTDVTIDFSYSAQQALPESRLIVMDRGTHLSFYAHPDAAAVQAEARAFLAAS